jgi:hypothetical protein
MNELIRFSRAGVNPYLFNRKPLKRLIFTLNHAILMMRIATG